MMLQLNPPLPVVTPKGKAIAHFVIDYGTESDLYWVCALDSTGECWVCKNPNIRFQKNITEGREYISPFYDPKEVAFRKEMEKPCGCHDQQASEPVSHHAGLPARNFLHSSTWLDWGHYLPDVGRFIFTTHKGSEFMGWRRVDVIDEKTIVICLDKEYDPQIHGMIMGWKPYE